jgi:His-Xaa-Ser system protein HxsD
LLAGARLEEPSSTAAAVETDDQFFRRNLSFIERDSRGTLSKRFAERNSSFLPELDCLEFRTLTARFLHQNDDGLLMEVDLEVYGLAALLKVAQKFTDRCFVHLQRRNEQIIEVRFRSKGSQVPLDSIAGEFCNEVLDQRLREVVARESEPVRNLVLAHALSRVGLANSEPKAPQDDDPGSK